MDEGPRGERTDREPPSSQPPAGATLAGRTAACPSAAPMTPYEAPGRSAWTLVAQTSAAITAQRVTVHVTGGLPNGSDADIGV